MDVIFLRRGCGGEMPFPAIDDEADTAFARENLLECKPPGLADAIGKRRRHIDREGNAMARQYRIGRCDQILVGSVERQAHKPPRSAHDHCAAANLIHIDNVIFPALQRPQYSIEKSRGNFAGLERLKTAGAPGAHAFEPQDGARAAAFSPAAAAEIGELEPQTPQQYVVGWQVPAS